MFQWHNMCLLFYFHIFRPCNSCHTVRCPQTGYVLVGTLGIGHLPDGRIKQWLANCVFLSMFRIMGRVFSNVVSYHNLHNRPKSDGICVANHTSPIDCIVLAQDGCYSFVSQVYGTQQDIGCEVGELGVSFSHESL